MEKFRKFGILLTVFAIAFFSCEKEKTLISIEVTTQPTKKTYIVGDAFDITDMVVTAIYSDGSKEPVSITYDMLSYDFMTAGTDITVTITYEGKTATITEITVTPLVMLVSITISGEPKKTEYFVNAAFIPEGITVTATYSDNSTAIIPITELVFEYSFTTAGTDKIVTISFTYKGITKTAEIKGITVIEQIEFELGSLQKILNGHVVRAIAFDSKGNAWVGTQGHELIRYNENETIVYNSDNSVLPKDFGIWDIAVDKNDNVWIGASDGVWKYDGNEFTLYNSQNTAMPEDIVWSIAVDSKNNIWMASCWFRLGGLVKFDGTKWTTYTPDNSALPTNGIKSIAIDQLDNVWLALSDYVTQAYMVKISNNDWEVYDENDFGFRPYYFGGIQCDRKNRVVTAIDYSLSSTWNHSSSPGAFIFDGENTISLFSDSPRGFQKVFIDHKDNIWGFGVGKDCVVWNSGYWIKFDRSEFGGSSVWVIKEDTEHRIWFGTESGIYIRPNNH
jgi:hypothetical protein